MRFNLSPAQLKELGQLAKTAQNHPVGTALVIVLVVLAPIAVGVGVYIARNGFVA
jgi:hypothetical protein